MKTHLSALRTVRVQVNEHKLVQKTVADRPQR